MSEEDDMDQMMQNIRQIRDDKRPSMEKVVAVFDRIFSKDPAVISNDRGPETWSWVDMSQAALGFYKWFVLSYSTMDGVEGYPLVTVRQSTAPRLDAWLTVSQLVVGPDDNSIETSLGMVIANLNGAFFGLRQAVSDVIANLQGSPAEILDKLANKDGLN